MFTVLAQKQACGVYTDNNASIDHCNPVFRLRNHPKAVILRPFLLHPNASIQNLFLWPPGLQYLDSPHVAIDRGGMPIMP